MSLSMENDVWRNKMAIEELCARVSKLEKQVEKLTKKANPSLHKRCKDYLRQGGGNFPAAIDLAEKQGDTEAAKLLERERENLD